MQTPQHTQQVSIACEHAEVTRPLTSSGPRRWRVELPCGSLQSPDEVLIYLFEGAPTPQLQGEALPLKRVNVYHLPRSLSMEVGLLRISVGDELLEISLRAPGLGSEAWETLASEAEQLLDLIANNSPIGMLDEMEDELSIIKRLQELLEAVERALEQPKSKLTTREAWGSLNQLTPNATTVMSFVQTLSLERVMGALTIPSVDLPENRFVRFALEAALYKIEELQKQLARAQLSSADSDEWGELDEFDAPLLEQRQGREQRLLEALKQLEELKPFAFNLIKRCDYLGISRAERPTPNSTLFQSPHYARVYRAFIELEEELSTEPQELMSMEVARPRHNVEAWRLYEGWCGLRILAELRSLPGFKASPLPLEWAQRLFNLQDLSSEVGMKNASISFVLTHEEQPFWTFNVTLWAQREELIKGQRRVPDYVLSVTSPWGKTEVVFDAKLRRYESFSEALFESFEMWYEGKLEWLPNDISEAKGWVEGTMGRGYGLDGKRIVWLLHPNASLIGEYKDQRTIACRSYVGGSYYFKGQAHALSERFGFLSLAPQRAGDLRLALRWLLLYRPHRARPAPENLPCVACGEVLRAVQCGGGVHRDLGQRLSTSPNHNYDCSCGVHLVMTRCHQCHYPLFKGGKLWSLPGINENYNYDCPRCAENLNEAPPMLKESIVVEHGYVEQTCPRCGGRGDIPCWNHISNGVCFRCHGVGTITVQKSGDEARVFAVNFHQHIRHLDYLTFDQGDLPTHRKGRPIKYSLKAPLDDVMNKKIFDFENLFLKL